MGTGRWCRWKSGLVQEVHAGQAETLKREADLKQAYGASAPQTLPPGQGMDGASAPPALAADEE